MLVLLKRKPIRPAPPSTTAGFDDTETGRSTDIWHFCRPASTPASCSYKLAKTIVHGLFVLMTCPVGVSAPVDWLSANCTIVSVFFSSGGPKPSSALAA